MKQTFWIALFILINGIITPLKAAIFKVKTVAEFKAQVNAGLKPSDTIQLANGTWRDADLVFKGQGTEKQPIHLMAETAGQVVLEGASSIQIGRAHV